MSKAKQNLEQKQRQNSRQKAKQQQQKKKAKIKKQQLLALMNIQKMFDFGYALIKKARTKKQLEQALQLSKSYMLKIKAIKKHVKVKLPEQIQKGFCKKCYVIFVPDKTVKYRIKHGRAIAICLNCGSKRIIG